MSTTAERRSVAAMLCDFFRCPTTGRVLDAPKGGDDRVLCGCNPRGTHVKVSLQKATVDEWIAQHEREAKSWRTLVRVERVGATWADVVLPAWDSGKLITIALAGVPPSLCMRFVNGFRCHARVNIGAENANDLNFTDWEA